MLTRIAACWSFLLLAACAGSPPSSSSHEPVLTGDRCEVYTDATACDLDADCQWLGTGCACPDPQIDPTCHCPPGACVAKSGGGSGSGSGGSGSSGAGCACPNGEVCFEQIGGPAQQTGTAPTIACTLPAPGTGDPCARVQDEGTCTDSTTVSGLCVCDNGIR